jgi:hypothetical protein
MEALVKLVLYVQLDVAAWHAAEYENTFYKLI